jgi:hypothetical protein
MSLRASKPNAWVLVVGVAAALQAGCSGDPTGPSVVVPAPDSSPLVTQNATPTPSPDPTIVVRDGDWQGTTSHRQPVSFTVSSTKISRFTILIWLNGRACHLPFTATPMARVAEDGRFAFSTSGSVAADFTGRFHSDRQMTGSFSVTRLSGPCRIDGPVSASGTYAARRK